MSFRLKWLLKKLSNFMIEHILITGAFGFVGSNLSVSLKKEGKFKLTAIDVQEPATHNYNAYFNWENINKVDWNSIDVIIHLAGKAHDTKNTSDENSYFDINLGLSQKIFKQFVSSNASKFIFFSSVKAAADKVNEEFLTEEEIPNPQTFYGKSKLETEKYLLSQSLPGNKKVFILRPCMIHGPGNKGNLNLLYQLVSKGIPWPLGKFENKRSFSSIENLTFIVQNIIEKNIEGGIFNVADDAPISTNRLIELIAESKNRKARILKINQSIITKIAKFGDVIHLPLNTERLKKLTQSYQVSNKKIKENLGIISLPVSSEEGLRKTLQSFK